MINVSFERESRQKNERMAKTNCCFGRDDSTS
jgi:hypothetical protein